MIRWDNVWTLAAKEFKEFRRNKFILYSLVLMPFLLATVLPALYVIPVSMFVPDPQKTPLDLNITIDIYDSNMDVESSYAHNVEFRDCNLTNVVGSSCIFINCTLNDCVIERCQLNGSVVDGCVVNICNLDNVTRINSLVQGSVVVGETTEAEVTLLLLINTMLLFFLLIPTIVPTVVASYTIVGEKLNRSLEPLLMTPTTDLELLLGKSASIFIPSVVVTWLAFIPFVIIIDVFAAPVLGYAPLPSDVFLIGVFLTAPLICLLAIFANVIVSSRVNDVRSAQQIGSLVILPVVGFFVIMLAGVATLNVWLMLLFAGAIALADLAVLYVALRLFRREEILVNWK